MELLSSTNSQFRCSSFVISSEWSIPSRTSKRRSSLMNALFCIHTYENFMRWHHDAAPSNANLLLWIRYLVLRAQTRTRFLALSFLSFSCLLFPPVSFFALSFALTNELVIRCDVSSTAQSCNQFDEYDCLFASDVRVCGLLSSIRIFCVLYRKSVRVMCSCGWANLRAANCFLKC